MSSDHIAFLPHGVEFSLFWGHDAPSVHALHRPLQNPAPFSSSAFIFSWRQSASLADMNVNAFLPHLSWPLCLAVLLASELGCGFGRLLVAASIAPPCVDAVHSHTAPSS